MQDGDFRFCFYFKEIFILDITFSELINIILWEWILREY